jgi:hypothetical protein
MCDMLFLPIIQIYLEVFICIRTTGDDITDSYLYKDCYVHPCWEGEHAVYATIGAVLLLCYVPIAVYLRPTWQENLHDLHVLQKPKFLVLKSVFQILLVST